MIKMAAMLSHSKLLILQVSIRLPRILFGFSSTPSFSYFSLMWSVYVHPCLTILWMDIESSIPSVLSRMNSSPSTWMSNTLSSGRQLK